MKRTLPIAALAAGLVLAISAPAFAQDDEAKRKARAKALYERGDAQYNLGRWKNAIDFFQKSYEEYPAPVLLFNIAQSYRQWGDCQNGLFFYRRYLAVSPNASNRSEVEDFIKDLEEACKQKSKEPLDIKQPDHDVPPTDDDKQPKVVVLDDDDEEDEEDDGTLATTKRAATRGSTPTMFAGAVEIGPAFMGLGNLEVPPQFSLSVGAGYPIAVGPMGLEVGGLVTYAPVPWENGPAGASGTAGLTAILANLAVLYPIIDNLSLRADAGLGVLVFSGLDVEGNVFLLPGRVATAPLSMFHLRVGAGAEYAITPNLVVTAHPVVFSYSPPKEDMREDIESLTRFELLVGVGYKM